MAHARFAPSKSNIWLACSGSVNMSDDHDLSSGSTAPAREGTAAHWVAEKCLVKNKRASEYLGYIINVENDKICCDQEMVDGVQLYVDEVTSHEKVKTHKWIEQRVAPAVAPDLLFGTADYILLNRIQSTLVVADLKYGRNVVVEAVDNPQLMLYGLGAIYLAAESFGIGMDLIDASFTVSLGIIQPRAYHPNGPIRYWDVPAKDLLLWEKEIVTAAVESAAAKVRTLVPGDHCRYCPNLGTCPSYANMMCELAKVDFDIPVLPDPKDMSDKDLHKVLQLSSVILAWKDRIAHHIQKRMEKGGLNPHYKLVRKRTKRRWKPDAAAELSRLIGDEAYKDQELITIAAAEKVIEKEAIVDLWDRPQGAVTLALADDKRPALPGKAVDDFKD